ncbi:MAG: leucyl aminopeptidase [Chitinophagales bacterium]|jgi:leucyl aminopeptidase|nr:leucyl aminopeptidase [Chitinophagales bacterium]
MKFNQPPKIQLEAKKPSATIWINPSATQGKSISFSGFDTWLGQKTAPVYPFLTPSMTHILAKLDANGLSPKSKESARKLGANLGKIINQFEINSVHIECASLSKELALCLLEGLALHQYRFDKYLSKKKKALSTISCAHPKITKQDLQELNTLLEATYIARDLVNEPVLTLNAGDLSNQAKKLGKDAGISVDVWDKKRIKKEGFGGLIAVNMGSPDEPTFTIMEYKPKNAVNKQPLVLVGKGVVYDTGGLSLKPTAGSMDTMKSDMAGSAAVMSAIYAIAKNKLPIHTITLIPATDNRPGGNAITPGDIITMHNGKTVEILNTDAEGRLILGDALSYASKYKPDIVLDMATLTGAQVIAIGSPAAAIMGTANLQAFNQIRKAGDEVHERVAELPFYEDYDEMIKSNIADIKNIGGREAGSITAGKFLSHFVSYPWIHIDIAGPSFNEGSDKDYLIKGGTGFGVRLLYQFAKSRYTTL